MPRFTCPLALPVRQHSVLGALLLAASLLVPVGADAGTCANAGVPGAPYSGFGVTPGGAGKPIYRVTSRADSGPGSLREALSGGHRCVEFDVSGDIVLKRQLYVTGPYVTIDGFSALAPGITIRGYGISMWGGHGAHDIILRGVRFRDAGLAACAGCWDGIQIKDGASRIVVDHVSINRGSDGAIDIAESSDVTVQWSIVSGTINQSLLSKSTRVSMHHNLFIGGHNRNPQADWDAALATAPPATVLDFRNNVVWAFSGYGTLVRRNATANVVNNYYHSPKRPGASQALVVDYGGRVYAAGNYSGTAADVDVAGTERRPFPSTSVNTTEACDAAYEVQDEAGARGGHLGSDAVDVSHLAKLPSAQLPGCTPGGSVVHRPSPRPAVSTGAPDLAVSSLSLPGAVQRGRSFAMRFGVTNRGAGAAVGSRVKIFLSTDAVRSANDVLLRTRPVSSLAPGASQSHALTEVVPAGVKPGKHYVLVVVDVDSSVGESKESNNVSTMPIAVR